MTRDSEAARKARSVLLVAYHFPPSAAIGGARPAFFAKHLPAFGWDPAVLTVKERFVEQLDRGRLAGLENVPVTGTTILPTLRDLYLALKRTALLLLRKKQETNPPPAPAQTGGRETTGQRLKRWVVSLVLTLPDTETGWILPAVIRAVREIGKRKSVVLFTTCPPYSVHLIGLIVKKLTGVAWAADFRDPWATAGRKVFPTSRLSRAIESRLEAAVMQSADVVITTVEKLASVYRERYPGLPADRFLCIPNAVDLPARRTNSLPKYETFTLSYTGSLYFGRTPEPVFAAVRQLIDAGRIDAGSIRIRLVGQCRFLEDRPIEAVISSHGLGGLVEVQDTVPQAAAREIIERSHVALLLAPEQPYQIPAKFYEYLALGTPLLAVAGPGATTDLVAASRCGKAFIPSDIAGMAQFIQDMMQKPSPAPVPTDLLSQFEPRRLTALLALRFDRIAAGSLHRGSVQDA